MKLRLAPALAFCAVALAACGSQPATSSPVVSAGPSPSASSSPVSQYPLHTDIVATYFYGGEPASAANNWQTNQETAWCGKWTRCFGGVDTPTKRQHGGAWPAAFKPRENPFYVSLPCNEFDERGLLPSFEAITRQIPWDINRPDGSALKNRWVEIVANGRSYYAQWEETGPFEFGGVKDNDCEYVFSTDDRRPKNIFGHRAGIDISPAVAYAIGFDFDAGYSTVSWRFVDFDDVPPGPWTEIVTASRPYWP